MFKSCLLLKKKQQRMDIKQNAYLVVQIIIVIGEIEYLTISKFLFMETESREKKHYHENQQKIIEHIIEYRKKKKLIQILF